MIFRKKPQVWSSTYKAPFTNTIQRKIRYDMEKQFHIMGCNYSSMPQLRRLFNWSRDDVIKWKHFPLYWPFVRGIHRSPVNSPHKGQWRGALMFLLICAWINGWVNNREAGDFRRHRAHYDVTVMPSSKLEHWCKIYIPLLYEDVFTHPCPKPDTDLLNQY